MGKYRENWHIISSHHPFLPCNASNSLKSEPCIEIGDWVYQGTVKSDSGYLVHMVQRGYSGGNAPIISDRNTFSPSNSLASFGDKADVRF